MSGAGGLQPVVISAPFGNYIQPERATPTLGTFTALRRRGRVWRVIKTVRRYRKLDAWVNKIGLRNPGIDWLVGQERAGKKCVADKLVSVHGFDDQEWRTLLEKAKRLNGGAGPMGLELNMSCPNVGEEIGGFPAWLFGEAVATGVDIIVKLPPVRYSAMAEAAIGAGVRAFHCCNTLPVPGGGMSGKPLMPVALRVVEDIAGRLGGGGTVIGGGGVTTVEDARAYRDAGATNIALGTRTMHPKYLLGERDLRGLVDGIGEAVRA